MCSLSLPAYDPGQTETIPQGGFQRLPPLVYPSVSVSMKLTDAFSSAAEALGCRTSVLSIFSVNSVASRRVVDTATGVGEGGHPAPRCLDDRHIAGSAG